VLQAKISIYENVTINQDPVNGIGKPALDILQAAIFLIHGWSVMRGNVGRHSITDGDSEEMDGVIAYHLDVATAAAVNGMPT
jgi:hypothetical protein